MVFRQFINVTYFEIYIYIYEIILLLQHVYVRHNFGIWAYSHSHISAIINKLLTYSKTRVCQENIILSNWIDQWIEQVSTNVPGITAH